MIYRFNKCSRKELVRLRDRISEMLEKEPNTQEFTLELSVEGTIMCSINRRKI